VFLHARTQARTLKKERGKGKEIEEGRKEGGMKGGGGGRREGERESSEHI